ncbi:MAG TPA: S8 family serine peptidase [Flavobacteriales bacterium]|nr:S8 family serine peptidase [Flavobacteriales bacterium]HNU56745.1 S8 family serine peptidase [Flavobacteriales bacterium]
MRVLVFLILSIVAAPGHSQDASFWGARDTVLAHVPGTPKVRIGIWDSGVDTALFREHLARNAQGAPILRGYDAFKDRQDIPMALLPDSLATRSTELNQLLRALDDLDSGVESQQAAALKARHDSLPPAEQDRLYDAIDRYSGHVHGTAVADIALAGLADAEIVIARMEWWHGSPPVPCWSRELADKEAASIRDLLDFQMAQGVRVVVMSWGRAGRAYLKNLEECAPEMPDSARIALAQYTITRIRAELIAGMQAAPQVLFVGAAGNSGKSLDEADQATRFVLPNFLLVGAADRDGNDMEWSNTGKEVSLLGLGERVPARLPDGSLSYPSGTSMAAPYVANAAVKVLLVSPDMSGAALRDLLERTATVNAAGSRVLHVSKAIMALDRER